MQEEQGNRNISVQIKFGRSARARISDESAYRFRESKVAAGKLEDQTVDWVSLSVAFRGTNANRPSGIISTRCLYDGDDFRANIWEHGRTSLVISKDSCALPMETNSHTETEHPDSHRIPGTEEAIWPEGKLLGMNSGEHLFEAGYFWKRAVASSEASHAGSGWSGQKISNPSSHSFFVSLEKRLPSKSIGARRCAHR
jgi:hypothetical protein